jgi:Glycosyl transferase family 2
MSVVILCSKSRPHPIVDQLLTLFPDAVRADPLEPPVKANLIIHVETPVYVWTSSTSRNVFVRNLATYTKEWDAYMPLFDQVIEHDAVSSMEIGGEPPVVQPPTDLPPISIVTLMHNRPEFFDLACHNLMITDYPKTNIEWIIVDDSDVESEQVKKVAAATTLKIVYLYLPKTPVAAKRNMGVAKATAEIILMMDDDDHYPETSIRRRVGWLGHPRKPQAAAATTIACYDLVRGISAVNTPPLTLSLGKRVSEATLTFYKSWWSARPFPESVQIGEAEGFIAGRELDVMEIPPQQIIVAFSHGKNLSGRRVPGGDITPGCFWGFPKEFLVFIHGLAGIKVVEN